MIQVSPIKVLHKLDRIDKKYLYLAGDFSKDRPLWLHLSGTKLTTDKNYAWYGTRRQFSALCDKYEWGHLRLINKPKNNIN